MNLLSRKPLLWTVLFLIVQGATALHGATLTVNSIADNLTAGDGSCTLREAIVNANGDTDSTSGDCAAGAGADIIEFDGASVPDNSIITLALGELLLTSDISILPRSPVEGLTIDANASVASQSRVFLQNSASSDVVIDSLTITGGVTDEQGGGYYLQSGNSLVLTNSRITDNQTLSTGSNGDGGGIRIAAGTVTMTDVTIDGNISSDDGGAINVSGGGTSVTLTNLTMCNNEAGDDGGAIEATGSSTVTITYSTIYNNSNGALNQGGNGSSTGGGIHALSSASVTLEATILTANWDCNNECGTFPDSPDGDDTRNDCQASSGGSISSNGVNLLETYPSNNCSSVASDIVCPAECSGANSWTGLGPIGDNGGPVATHGLDCDTSPAADQIPTSNALCSGGNDADARGVARPGAGGGTDCDIGAFECTTSLVPVTLSYFESHSEGASTLIEWSTATEVGTVGFNLYEETPTGRRQLNSEMIAAGFDSTRRQDYYFHTIHALGGNLYLEEVDLTHRRGLKGPFQIGESYGLRREAVGIDWSRIEAELDAARPTLELSAASALDEPFPGPKASRPPGLAPRGATSGAQFLISQAGLYRITRDELLPYGLDLAQFSPTSQSIRGQRIGTQSLRLTAGGQPVYFHLQPGEDGFVEFWGEPLDSLYTKVNIYRLESLAGSRRVHSAPIPEADRKPDLPWAMDRLVVEENRDYSFLSPADDPWSFHRFIARGEPVQESFPFEIESLVPGVTQTRLAIELWGLSSWPAVTPDHHVVFEINGTEVAETRFDGLRQMLVQASIPSTLLQEGANELVVRVPGDTGPPWDIVLLEKFTIEYPRTLQARGGVLDIQAPGKSFEVRGLPEPEALVWFFDRRPVRWHATASPGTDGFHLVVPAKAPGRYAVVSESALLTAEIEPLSTREAPSLQGVDTVMISHPSLIPSLSPLVDAHRQRGLEVAVVDVETLFDTHSHGIFDPAAIQSYIRAEASDDLKFILLVGGDTYDYRNFLGNGSISLIPSLYASTDDLVRWAPVDPLFADLDGDNLPDLPIGRLPARTPGELQTMIQKILDYGTSGASPSALFIADDSQEIPFAAISRGFAGRLPAGWSTQQIHLDDQPVQQARQAILDGLEAGQALTSFIGHSGPNSWTFDGLFTAEDARILQNQGRATVLTQWGCWNTYYVDPEVDTLAHAFLLHDGGGAAAVLGATTITESASEQALGEALMQRLFGAGLTLGEAIQAAKEDLAQRAPDRLDVLLGWTLLGDPALLLETP